MVPPRPEAFGVWIRTPAIRSTAMTASAMIRAFWSFAMGPEDSTQASLGPDRAEARVDRIPVQGVEPGGHVIGALVLVLQVVGVLPNVDAQDRGHLFHERAVLVGVALDGKLARAIGHKPRPSAAKLSHCGLLELLLERVVAAECVLQRVGDAAVGVAAAAGTHDRPEDRVVGMAPRVVADHGPDVLGHGVDAPQQVLHGLAAELGMLLE